MVEFQIVARYNQLTANCYLPSAVHRLTTVKGNASIPIIRCGGSEPPIRAVGRHEEHGVGGLLDPLDVQPVGQSLAQVLLHQALGVLEESFAIVRVGDRLLRDEVLQRATAVQLDIGHCSVPPTALSPASLSLDHPGASVLLLLHGAIHMPLASAFAIR